MRGQVNESGRVVSRLSAKENSAANSRGLTGAALFVSQGLNRIETRRSYRRNHPADQSHQRQDCSRNQYADRGNDESNVTRLSVLGKRAVKGKIPHRERNDIGEHDP